MSDDEQIKAAQAVLVAAAYWRDSWLEPVAENEETGVYDVDVELAEAVDRWRGLTDEVTK